MTNLEIEAFLEIQRAGSISRAAQNLYVTQPALSRRIKALEEELGYPVFERRKGKRNITLTRQGEAFISVAHKWLGVWQEAREIHGLDSPGMLHLSSVGSVSSYILPGVFEQFSRQNPGVSICFHNYHSYEAYQYIDSGLIDIAFISDDMYYKNVETIPAFSEPMVLVTNSSEYPSTVSPATLKPNQEIRLPWNPEYDAWHNYWFQAKPEFKVSLDQMDLLEQVLQWKDTWAIVPMSVAHRIATTGHVSIHHLESPPPDRITYYLKQPCRQSELITVFLKLLHEKLSSIPHVTSYL